MSKLEFKYDGPNRLRPKIKDKVILSSPPDDISESYLDDWNFYRENLVWFIVIAINKNNIDIKPDPEFHKEEINIINVHPSNLKFVKRRKPKEQIQLVTIR